MLKPLLATLLLTVAPALAPANAAAPSTRPAKAPSILPGGPDAWTLVWEDEFDGTEADLDSNWISQNGPSGHILCSRWRENVSVANGMLRLTNRKENRGGQNWTSGNIWTRRDFQYGYYEARYRYAAAPATNNSFWIMTRQGGTTRPAKGARFEIDINEGHYPSSVNTNIHNWSDLIEVNGKMRSQSSHKGFNLGNQPDRTFQLEIPVTTKRLRITSENSTHFHIRELRVFAPPKAGAAGNYPSILRPVPKDGPIDLARDPANKLTVSGMFDGNPQAGQTNNVAHLTDNNPDTSWITQRSGTKSVELEFPKPVTVGCVQFLAGWKAGDSWNGMPENFRVQYHNGTDWVDISTFDAKDSGINFARDFNTFGLDWTESELVFYLNGKEIRRVKNSFCHSPAPIWLSLAIITWHGKVTDAIDNTFMEVDYVRVYQRKP